MPQFEMPPRADDAARPDTASTAPSAPDDPLLPGAEGADPLRRGELPDTPAPDGRRRRARGEPRRFGWRQLAIAAVVGVLAGGTIPALAQVADGASARAHAEALRSVADEYLTAIADGRARVATELSPVTGRVAPDAVLRAADPITDATVQFVQTDGAAGTADVRYRVGGTEVFRTLDAVVVDGQWRLTTSLSEVADVRLGAPIGEVQVAGVPLGGEPLRLYPGAYRVDAISGPYLLSGGDEFVVDGDARTPTVPYVTVGVVPRIRDFATELALDSVADCQMRARCPIDHGLRLLPVGEPYPVDVDQETGAIDLAVPIMALDGDDTRWFDVRLRVLVDDEGVPTEWRCGLPGEADGPLYRCSL